MCKRYYIEEKNPELKEIVLKAEAHSALKERLINKFAKPVRTSGDIKPNDLAPVIATSRSGRTAVFPMKWGFSLSKTNTPIINAKVETAATKRSFAESWVRRRCIIPASWYYEWQHFKTPDGKSKKGDKYLIQPVGSSVTWLCGLYRFEENVPVFTILIRPAENDLAVLHDRMPVIIPKELIKDWINIESNPEDLLKYALTDMVIARAEEQTLLGSGTEEPYLPWLK